ncbi:MAG: MurR/RpiR family transcriptional regulator [Ilumatobacteraceae bacterium]
MDVEQRIAKAGGTLTPAERRAAEVVLERPQLVAFGTVADLAEQSSVGAATVVRLASKLGFDGFSALQSAVQRGLARQLRPAHERIRERGNVDNLEHHVQLEVENVRTTLGGLDVATLELTAQRLSAGEASVWVVSGDASLGVVRQFVDDLSTLRDGVHLIDSNPVRVTRQVSMIRAGDAVVAVDVRRYDRWVVDLVGAARAAEPWCLAVTDRLLSPLAGLADATVVVAAGGVGPFDSHVGTLALFNVIVAAVADRVRESAASRLDRAESAWRAAQALVEG